eukprot:TCALIF_02179-PA protein Name:"Protein of unknown function" AED:0.13 eAED:0.13 QI:0/0.5/0/1/0/0/3/0/90
MVLLGVPVCSRSGNRLGWSTNTTYELNPAGWLVSGGGTFSKSAGSLSLLFPFVGCSTLTLRCTLSSVSERRLFLDRPHELLLLLLLAWVP